MKDGIRATATKAPSGEAPANPAQPWSVTVACQVIGEDHSNISKYERSKNEPCLMVLLAYSRLAEIPLEQIIDDAIELR